jgi:hypothetical protein
MTAGEHCHVESSETSRCSGEILRIAQDDKDAGQDGSDDVHRMTVIVLRMTRVLDSMTTGDTWIKIDEDE